MEDVASFRLDWCKVKSLPKAAWVGENCMAYMRLMSYTYGMYFSCNQLSSREKETCFSPHFIHECNRSTHYTYSLAPVNGD